MLKMPQPLTEKYRPKTLNDVQGNLEVLSCLKSMNIENLPNMLFYGPPGTGKTTTIRALLKDLPKINILELNASDERGIDTVRHKIKEFSATKSNTIKVVILDEADSMSKDAQSALRRIIEDFRNTRFCIICNYLKKIIDPIVSRCTKFRFAPVNNPNRIKEVCLKEEIIYEDEGIEMVDRYSDGDMRKVMNDIQGLKGSFKTITKKNVLDFYGLCDDAAFREIFEILKKDDFSSCLRKIRQFNGNESGSVDGIGLLENISSMLIKSDIKNKLEICKQLADIEYRLSQGCSDAVQINAIIAAFILLR
jgi:replication factor C subunit 3/5